jgi:contractile injection system tube protein/LysM domain-containing protein
MAFEGSLAGALQGMVKAHLEVVNPPNHKVIPFRFNPTEYQLAKTNNFAELPIPGLVSPPIQFVRGGSEKLTLDLLVDTSDTLEDVCEKYTNDLRGLMDIASDLHAPPVVQLVWDRGVFTGVVESLTVTYTLFSPKGVPLRAKCAMGLKEFVPIKQQLTKANPYSPDFDKAWTVRRGDTLSSVAGAVFKDPARWRDIARASAIDDPRTLEPGTVLSIPRLR